MSWVVPTHYPEHPDRTLPGTDHRNTSHFAEEKSKYLEDTRTQMLFSSGYQQPRVQVLLSEERGGGSYLKKQVNRFTHAMPVPGGDIQLSSQQRKINLSPNWVHHSKISSSPHNLCNTPSPLSIYFFITISIHFIIQRRENNHHRPLRPCIGWIGLKPFLGSLLPTLPTAKAWPRALIIAWVNYSKSPWCDNLSHAMTKPSV